VKHRRFWASVLLLLAATAAAAQRPRLVVVVVVDQFPFEFLTRFEKFYGPGGFRRLLRQGASFNDATYEHAHNTTGPGHAVLSSGCYALHNGITGNTWYDVSEGTKVYCVGDERTTMIPAGGPGRSPANLYGTTLGDRLRQSTRGRSSVIALSLKDRSAILLGGKSASAAYWFSDSLFVTSTYYRPDLPAWVTRFNAEGRVRRYFGRVWNRFLPDSAYRMMDSDDAPYEAEIAGLGRTFPHRVDGGHSASVSPSFLEAFTTTPFANEVLLQFAERAVREEKLGKRGVTDLLCISFSANDYIGHAFGPDSHEVLDISVRTDSILAELLKFLDAEVGAGTYVVAFSSDHGIVSIPEFLIAHRPGLGAGRVRPSRILETCDSALTARFGSGSLSWLESIISRIAERFGRRKEKPPWVAEMIDGEIYLSRESLASKNVPLDFAAAVISGALRTLPEVAAVYTGEEIRELSPTTALERRIKNGYREGRSGDVLVVLKPYLIEGDEQQGTTHDSPYDYNAHVPLLILGPGIRPGVYNGPASPADLAPTLAALLGIADSVKTDGRILVQALR
jgi:predicted AlkP superfamily pyrophosphatase or phosphodiesterase